MAIWKLKIEKSNCKENIISLLQTKKGKLTAVGGALLLIVVVLGLCSLALGDTDKEVQTTSHTVEKGTIRNTISGSGAVQPIERYDVVSLVSGDIISADFEEGGTVKKGQVLFNIDSSDMTTSLAQAQANLEKAKMNYTQAKDTANDLNIKADFNGNLVNLTVGAGDEVKAGEQIGVLRDTSKMTATLYFNISSVSYLTLGQEVDVLLEDYYQYTTGTIVRIGSGNITVDGGLVREVEVEISNPGALAEGCKISVNASGISSYNSAVLQFANEQILTAAASGTITSVNYSSGDYVLKGSTIAVVDSDASDTSLRSEQLSFDNAQIALENVYEKIADYTLTSPIDGTVISKTYKAGDSLDGNKTTLAVIADMNSIYFEMDVDEMDIQKVKVGQEVTVTADAVSGKTFKGYVDSISIIGSSDSSTGAFGGGDNGVTTYPVKIVIEEYEGILPGMNVTGEIVISEANNILVIPNSAVFRGNLVKMTTADAGERAVEIEGIDAGKGYAWVEVGLGINDNNLVEITDGLNEGDVVYYSTIIGLDLTSDSEMVMNMPQGSQMPPGNRIDMSGGKSSGGFVMP